MTRVRVVASFAILTSLMGVSCNEDDDECFSTPKTYDVAGGDIKIRDADGRAFGFLPGPLPSFSIKDNSIHFRLGDAGLEIPRPVAVGSFPVEGRVCDLRPELGPFPCAEFRATLDVAELAQDCGPTRCALLTMTLRSDEPDDADPTTSSITVHGRLHLEREERVEQHCRPRPDSDGCSGRGWWVGPGQL